MNAALYAFLSLFALCFLLFVWTFRGVISNVRKVAEDHSKTMILPYVKCGVLMFLAGGAAFREAFQPVTKEAMEAMLWTDWVIKFIAPLAAMGGVLVGFLDNSVQTAKDERAKTTPPFNIPSIPAP